MDFRGYEHVTVSFRPGLNLVVGGNGQGKTNLLEAVHVLCAMGSHRTSSTEPLVRRGAERAVVRAAGVAHERPVRMDAEIRRGGGIRVLVNRVASGRTRGPDAGLSVVLFSPDDLAIVKGGPEERRRFLDLAATRVRPLASVERQELERVLRQRNGLLKAAQSSRRALATLDVWDEQLARAGAVVVRNRLAVLGRLAPLVRDRYRELACDESAVDLAYRAAWLEDEPPAGEDELAALMGVAVARARGRDLERGQTTIGPHRDDLGLSVGGMEARSFGSQGEQRTMALALRLAERELAAQARGEEPILLLDDVFSELDEDRRRRLAELVRGAGQTIATVTSIPGWPLAGRAAHVLRVERGEVFEDG